MALNIPVIYGSVRGDRQGIRAARYLMAQLAARGHRATLVDPLVQALPMLDRMYKEYPKGGAPAVMQELAALYRGADAFLICSGEYNNGIPPALKNLLDHFLEEYFWRPSAIACYSTGQFGGVRAAMQLRMSLAEMGMPSIPSLLPFPRIGRAVSETGELADPGFQIVADRFFAELEWYAEALRDRRRVGVPY